jgi:hypothetical protein
VWGREEEGINGGEDRNERKKGKKEVVNERPAVSRRQNPANEPPTRRRYRASVGCHDNIVQSKGAGCVQRWLIPDIALGEN